MKRECGVSVAWAARSQVEALRLLLLAMEGMSEFLGRDFEVLANLFRARGNRFSFENVLVCTDETGAVVGALCAYEAAREVELNRALFEAGFAVEYETSGQAGEIYVDSVAVAEAWRGRGLARAMFEALFERFGGECGGECGGFGGVEFSLLVEPRKALTKAFYERVGFKTCGKKQIYGIEYEVMRKRSESGKQSAECRNL